MYLRLINVKAIERQRDSYILVINNRYVHISDKRSPFPASAV